MYLQLQLNLICSKQCSEIRTGMKQEIKYIFKTAYLWFLFVLFSFIFTRFSRETATLLQV